MALSSRLAMLNTPRPAGERAKPSKFAMEMVSWVLSPPCSDGVGIPADNECKRVGVVY